MTHAEHAVTVEAPVELVWQILLDVRGYAGIFPPTRAVDLLEESERHQLARLHVDVGEEAQSWVSRRDIDAELRVITYQQVETAPIVGRMGGEWRAFALGAERTQLVLTHDFATREPIDGQVAGRYTFEEADRMLHAAVERNSVADLEAVKAESERRVRQPVDAP
ncbi:aromatase/cyclase [Dactylosporangium vinaceum]|uniref:Aromatase/cyclase n=1 Tax=Dactylosporangium vinaceum TaxID=53362 RepID=A0ABV5M371_9ACTN|nr:aromatase/cyclase [Dactylosporangium vinaceum]UAB99760.1 aromatase/cyclase [Dactylosporangium vinaceum]